MASTETVHQDTARWSVRRMREISAFILMGVLVAINTMIPTFDPSEITAIPANAVQVLSIVIMVAAILLYLTFQAWPLAHGAIGSTSAQTLDQLFSILPGVATLLFMFAAIAGHFQLGNLQYDMSAYVLTLNICWFLVVLFDIWVIGGFGNRVNRMVQEKMELK